MEDTKRSVSTTAASGISREPFRVTCADAVELGGMLIIPPQPKAVVQFNGGTAAKKEFYLPFLEFLAENGYLCCLWDYRGGGDSAPESMRRCDYTFIDYGLQDMPAIKTYLRRRYPDLPFFLFTHSVGGQLMGYLDGLEEVKGMVGYAVSTGYLPHMPLGYRLQSTFFFYVFTPLSILLNGYLRAARYGIMEDLPRNVVRQWRHWCSRRNYLFSPRIYGKSIPRGNYELSFPVHIFWSIDDPISNARSVPTFWSHVSSKAGIGFTKLNPAQTPLKKLGHFGFFRKKAKELLWVQALDKLDKMLES